jgi:hypothetical protein
MMTMAEVLKDIVDGEQAFATDPRRPGQRVLKRIIERYP